MKKVLVPLLFGLLNLATSAHANLVVVKAPEYVISQDVQCDQKGCVLNMLTWDLTGTRLIELKVDIPREWVEFKF